MQRAKQYAAEQETTLTHLLETALREKLARSQDEDAGGRRPALPTFSGNGPRPGVDLHDTAALLDLMDGADDRASS